MIMSININSNNKLKQRHNTLQRRLLLDIFREAKGHLNAKELYRKASEKDPRISMATVYRNLRLFKELGLIEEQRLDEVQCYYELKSSSEHYHMVCRGCGDVIEFASPELSKVLEEVQLNIDFTINRAVLYLEGYCNTCKEERRAEDESSDKLD